MASVRNEYLALAVLVCVCMGVGILIYLKAPNANFAMSYLELNHPGFHQTLSGMSYFFPEISKTGFIRYHLADFLWSFSLSAIVVTIWRGSLNYIGKLTVAILLPMSFEIGQYFAIFPGTFDMIDCVMTALGGILAVIAIQLIFRQEQDNNENSSSH